MGNPGRLLEQRRARELRAQAWTLDDIALELNVAKSSVSRWVRDVEFVPNPRRRSRRRGPNRLQRAKAAEIEHCRVEGIARVGQLSDREFLMAGLGLYAGDGAKGGTEVAFANSNPKLVAFFCAWFREFFDVDESRLRIHLYLHEGLDLEAATSHWSLVTKIPAEQFSKPYRAVADPTRRTSKHVYGCCHVAYSSAFVHRQILGMLSALSLVSCEADPG